MGTAVGLTRCGARRSSSNEAMASLWQHFRGLDAWRWCGLETMLVCKACACTRVPGSKPDLHPAATEGKVLQHCFAESIGAHFL